MSASERQTERHSSAERASSREQPENRLGKESGEIRERLQRPHANQQIIRPREPTPAEVLIAWFQQHRRDLPWRHDKSPYRVWVSEVMLQQTRAETVTGYFERFVSSFPDVHALAAASLDDVLKQWQGLGYYRRARLLHAAANEVVTEHGGCLPQTGEALRLLPGFGPYTSAAVAAFAFGQPVIAIDANVRRIGARWLGQREADDGAISTAFSGWLTGTSDPALVTEGLIELGALICTPRAPDCAACPLGSGCRAAATGAPGDFPRRKARKKPPTRVRYAAVCSDERGLWLARRPLEGLLGGMWGLPQSPVPPHGTELGTVFHAYTHFHLQLVLVQVAAAQVAAAQVASAAPAGQSAGAPTGGPSGEHIAWQLLPSLPLSGVDEKALAHLRSLGIIEALPAAETTRAMMPK